MSAGNSTSVSAVNLFLLCAFVLLFITRISQSRLVWTSHYWLFCCCFAYNLDFPFIFSVCKLKSSQLVSHSTEKVVLKQPATGSILWMVQWVSALCSWACMGEESQKFSFMSFIIQQSCSGTGGYWGCCCWKEERGWIEVFKSLIWTLTQGSAVGVFCYTLDSNSGKHFSQWEPGLPTPASPLLCF